MLLNLLNYIDMTLKFSLWLIVSDYTRYVEACPYNLKKTSVSSGFNSQSFDEMVL